MSLLCPGYVLSLSLNRNISYVVFAKTFPNRRIQGKRKGCLRSSTCPLHLWLIDIYSFESPYPVLCKTTFTIHNHTEKTLGPLPKVLSHSYEYYILTIILRNVLHPIQQMTDCICKGRGYIYRDADVTAMHYSSTPF